MTKKLLKGAVITTPLITINGVLAIYFQGLATASQTIQLGLILALFISVIWGINIFLVTKTRFPKNWQLYTFSFFLIVLIGLPFRWVAQHVFLESPFAGGFPTYPVVNALVVNSILWVIIEMVRSGEQKKEAQATIDRLKIENLEAQKQSLLRQVQPHFLFNALSTLKSLIHENQSSAETYTVKLSNFLRYSFLSESAGLVSLEKELEFVQNYIELQSIRFEDSFQYDVTIPEEAMTYQLPIFALQTLVENIFKHNYFSEKKPLAFRIYYENDTLIVWNKKGGLKLTERNETGLANLNKRYELTLGDGIVIMDRKDDFSVTLPLIKP